MHGRHGGEGVVCGEAAASGAHTRRSPQCIGGTSSASSSDFMAGSESDPWIYSHSAMSATLIPRASAAAGDSGASVGQDQRSGSRPRRNSSSSRVEVRCGLPPIPEEPIRLHGREVVPIRKVFYREQHLAVTAMSNEEVDRLRRELGIEVDGDTRVVPRPVVSFAHLGLPDFITERIGSVMKPTPIQAQAIPCALQGHDLIGIAPQGSGKTLAYLLPLIVHVRGQQKSFVPSNPIGVVVCRSRELAQQVNAAAAYLIGTSGLYSASLLRDERSRDQDHQSRLGIDIAIASPSCFRVCLKMDEVTICVLDEVDDMLDGNKREIDRILRRIRTDRQMLMFSRTCPTRVHALAHQYCTLCEPIIIRVGGDKLADCRSVEQIVFVVRTAEEKFDQLMEALKTAKCRGNVYKCWVFCTQTSTVDSVVCRLREVGIACAGAHGLMKPWQRQQASRDVKDGQLSVFVSTVVRGHEIPCVKYVVLYDCPCSVDEYVRRISCAGRAGETGYAMVLLTHSDQHIAQLLVPILSATNQLVPQDLSDLAEGCIESDGTAGGFETVADQGMSAASAICAESAGAEGNSIAAMGGIQAAFEPDCWQ